MRLDFGGEIIHWRGPAPFHFVLIPEPQASELRECANELSYGWGCMTTRARIGRTDFSTAVIPKDGTFAVPIKVAVRRAEGLELGDTVHIRLDFADPDPSSRFG